MSIYELSEAKLDYNKILFDMQEMPKLLTRLSLLNESPTLLNMVRKSTETWERLILFGIPPIYD